MSAEVTNDMPGEVKVDKVREGTPETISRKKTFMEELDDLVGEQPPAPDPVAVAEALAQEEEDDPGVPKAGFGHRSQWDALDALMAEEGVTKDAEAPPRTEGFEEHEWEDDESGRGAAIFSDDAIRWRCKKCFRLVDASREETIGETLDRHGVQRVCGEQLAQDVMKE